MKFKGRIKTFCKFDTEDEDNFQYAWIYVKDKIYGDFWEEDARKFNADHYDYYLVSKKIDDLENYDLDDRDAVPLRQIGCYLPIENGYFSEFLSLLLISKYASHPVNTSIEGIKLYSTGMNALSKAWEDQIFSLLRDKATRREGLHYSYLMFDSYDSLLADGFEIGSNLKSREKRPRPQRPKFDADKLIKNQIQSVLYNKKHPFEDLPY